MCFQLYFMINQKSEKAPWRPSAGSHLQPFLLIQQALIIVLWRKKWVCCETPENLVDVNTAKQTGLGGDCPWPWAGHITNRSCTSAWTLFGHTEKKKFDSVVNVIAINLEFASTSYTHTSPYWRDMDNVQGLLDRLIYHAIGMNLLFSASACF